LAQGKTFETVCAEANVAPLPPAPFSLQTRSLPEMENVVSLSELKNVAFSLDPGKTSNFVPTRQAGFILYLKARLPVSDEQMKTELPEFIAEMRRQRQLVAFNDWFSKEFEKAQIKMPPGSKGSLN
jgi:hypothetical protein